MSGRGKNEVTLTYAGDADQLTRANKAVRESTESVEKALDGVTAAAKRTDTAMSGIDASSGRLARIAGKGGADLRAYRSDLDGVGDGFNDVEDRAMGAGNIINGVNDMMARDDPATFAMGLSDLAAGMRYTVVPSLQDGAKGLSKFGSALGGVKTALVAGGALAAVALLAVHLKRVDEQQKQSRMDDFHRQLQRGGELSNEMAREMFYAADASGNLDKLMQAIAEDGGYAAAQRFAEQIELLGGDSEAMDALNAELSELEDKQASAADATAALTESLQRQQDEIRGQVDPLFDLLNTTRDLADAKADEAQATADLDAAIQEHGLHSPQAAAAARDLEAAHVGVGEAALSLTESERQLDVMLATGQITVGQMESIMADLESRGYTSGEAATYLRDRINEIQSKHVTVTADAEYAIQRVGDLYRVLSVLPEHKAITLGFSSHGIAELNRFKALADSFAGGGVVYAQGGHPGMPRGTDTVPAWMTPGEMVLNGRHQNTLFRWLDSGLMGGGNAGVTVNVYAAGSIRSDRDLVQLIRDEFARGGLR